MGKVFELPEDVIRRIAAGEVITRPVSVVKELVENSVDAGAKRIRISIEKGGKSVIDVMDDGEGMEEEDILLAIKPHTTSKIRDFDDIYRIGSFGFRGEALSSIVAVSETMIISKTEGMDLGTEVSVKGAKVVSVRKIPFQVGTRVVVKNLFFNLPARRRFLSSSAVEGRMVGDLIQKFLLSLLEHHIIFSRDGTQIYNAPPTADPLERILMVFPELSRDDVIGFENEMDGFKVRGFVSRIGKGLRTRIGQIFFVNRRYVRVSLLYKIIERVEKDVPLNEHPYVILYLQVPGKFVDINVHPQKLEVNFSNPRLISDLIHDTIVEVYRSRKSIRKIPPPSYPTSPPWKEKTERRVGRVETIPMQRLGFVREPTVSPAWEKGETMAEEYRFFGLFGGRYAILESVGEDGESKLIIMDVHGAHERIIYEELKKNERMESQILSFELSIPLDEGRLSLLKEGMDVLKRFGFDYEVKEGAVLLKAIPKILPVSSAKQSLIEFLDDLKLFGILDRDELIDSIRKKLAKISCSSALKTHDRMDERDVVEILKKLWKYGVKTCPHGRPIIVEMSMRDLDRIFERI